MTRNTIAVGIDLGGTNLKGGLVDEAGALMARRTGPTNLTDGPKTVVADMVKLIDTMLDSAGLKRCDMVGVGVGSPGPLSPSEGRIIRASNLPGWTNVPLSDILTQAIGKPVKVDNDANVAAFGEYWVGAGRDVEDLVMLTLGTGIGGGVILSGRILHGRFENAGELGHMIVDPGGLPCSCGQRGCLERYASADAVARRVVDAIKAEKSSALSSAVESGEPIDCLRVVDSARTGDKLCLHIWNEACRYLAIACVNIQHAFNPARIVLGGGMSGAGDFLFNRVREHFVTQRWSLHDDYPEIVPAGLGNDAGVIGAAGLAWGKDGCDAMRCG